MPYRLRAALTACCLVLCACGSAAAPKLPCSAATLRIVEIMVHPVGAPAAPEWIEVHNPGPTAAALEGLTLAAGVGKRWQTFTVESPQELLPGQRRVFGSGAGPVPPVDQAYGAALSLPKKRGTLRLECGERLIDAVTYGVDAVPAPERGVSLQRDGDCWCMSQGQRYDGVHVGTPGRRKPACPAHACAAP